MGRTLNLKFNKSLSYFLIAMLCIALVAIIVLKIKQKREIQWALNNELPLLKNEIKQVHDVDGDKNWSVYFKALDLKNVLKDNHDLSKLWADITIPITINTDPPGAKVYAKPCSKPGTSWYLIGKTPISKFPFPKGLSRIIIEKTEFKTLYDVFCRRVYGSFEGDTLQYQFFNKSEIPEDMVYATDHKGGSHSLFISNFWIDRYEVTNKQYKTFLDSGGYTNPGYWEFPFIIEDDTINFSDAKKRFMDKTGWVGPANWEMGDFPTGEGDLPVMGISWYEAAAYAKFVNKSLPTLYHWQYASEVDAASEIVKFGNFNKKGPVEKGTYNSMTRFGTFNLPGNISEWVFNSSGNNRFRIGGNYKEPDYL